MGQPRLNHVTVTAVHRGKIEQLDVDKEYCTTITVIFVMARKKKVCALAPPTAADRSYSDGDASDVDESTSR